MMKVLSNAIRQLLVDFLHCHQHKDQKFQFRDNAILVFIHIHEIFKSHFVSPKLLIVFLPSLINDEIRNRSQKMTHGAYG